jgi:MinD-like ATPase involved in chromosome partitioning or flagellar assembly
VEEIRAAAASFGSRVIAEVPFDSAVNASLMAGRTVVDYAPESPAAQSIAQIWELVSKELAIPAASSALECSGSQ